ncbi:MAG: hypothetical protein A3I66_18185 [Burkholderiales bacterium RIFCSPLOWO2_02_FULL_57_36]|nr:MAG: hypothetical protein A3I66_18185 [Burkholderiales bacterium RIFCSPLOWO2_02_FULL_57_36]
MHICRGNKCVIDARFPVDEIWHKANYDALTGLPNRLLFRDRLEQDVKHAERTGVPIALLFIELDDRRLAARVISSRVCSVLPTDRGFIKRRNP